MRGSSPRMAKQCLLRSWFCEASRRERAACCIEPGKRELLLRQLDGKLAIADAGGEAVDEFRHRVLAIGADQFGQCREQAGLREAIAVDAVVTRLRPGFVEIAER